MYKIAINRPITTLMFALTLVIFGIFALNKMPVTLWPDIDFPIVKITTKYVGAGPETIETKVTDKIEEAVMTIDGIEQVTSTSVRNMSVIVVKFELEKDINEAINDVRDKVSTVQLDSGVEAPTIDKADTSGNPVITLFVSSDKASPIDLMRFSNDVIKPALQRISGVGLVDLKGYKEREIKIFPNPTLVNKYGLTYSGISNTLRTENLEVDGGKIVNSKREWTILTDGQATTLEEIRNIRVADNVRLGDVADVQDGLSEDTTFAAFDGKPGVIFDVIKVAGENDISIANAVAKALPELRTMGSEYNIDIVNDSTDYVRSAIASVKFDLVLGSFLAVIIVLLFLRNMQITVISALTIPVSVLGTLAGMMFMGYTLNMMTLLAVTLAIGIIVDDAIVVIENIHRKLEHGMGKMEAAFEGVREIAFALVAISAMLLSVFIPIGNMSGIVGRFFQNFGITIALAILISYFVVVTVVPMMSSIFIKTGHSKFYLKTEPFFRKMESVYVSILHFVLRFKYSVIVCIFLIFAGSIALFATGKLGMEFFIKEDKGHFNVFIQTDPGISLEEMKVRTSVLQDMANKNPNVAYTSLEIGYSNKAVYKAKIYVKLKPIDERSQTQFQIMEEVRANLSESSYAKGMKISASEVSDFGGGDNSPYQITIIGRNQGEVLQSAERLMKIWEDNPRVLDVHSDWTEYQPEFSIKIDRAKLNQYHVSAKDLGNAISSAFSGEVAVAYFKDAGTEFNITVRVPDHQRVSIDDLKKIQVANADKELIFLDGLVELVESKAPSSIIRLDRLRSVTVYATPKNKSGLTIGHMLKETQAKEKEWLGENLSYKIQGEAKNASDSSKAFSFAITAAFILIYLILAALYESLIQPIIIMITLPLSFAGAFYSLALVNQPLSMFSMMGLMLLMGLVGKNATLVIDVANEKRAKGMGLDQAIIEAGEERLRPILMTTLAMVFGMLPLAISTGSGAGAKAPIGIVVIGGLLFSMVLSLLIVPTFYKILAPIDSWMQRFYKPKSQDIL
ncbi:efflux RND transporter permease subunit [Helicobacter pametensis]|uniref:efflux RND transporter permease subunit n=1 Tax=Helicobacter pametensis TaxID=95149 RepID=UPI0004835000|nr:efflux RND transporter permease subunit [Helicobacter pametensis]